MVKVFLGAAAVALIGGAALAQPTPAEQRSMHVGDTATNGSSTIVTDRYGTHPDGFVGQSVVNHISSARSHHRHHRHAYVALSDGGR